MPNIGDIELIFYKFGSEKPRDSIEFFAGY
jgi:hypothetical protein